MKASKIQLRGVCQECGRVHACTNGKIAKHGYTVDFGWFMGACSGSGHAPLNNSTEHTDTVIEMCGNEIVKTNALIESLADASFDYTVTFKKGYQRNYTYTEVKWCDLSYNKRDSHVAELKRKVNLLTAHIKFMTNLKSEIFGTPLFEVAKEEPSAYIPVGEKRIMVTSNGIEITVVCTRSEGRRIYYTYEGSSSSHNWISPVSWRKFQKV